MMTGDDPAEYIRAARASEESGAFDQALVHGWAALDTAQDDAAAIALVTRLCRSYPHAIDSERYHSLAALIRDSRADPLALAMTGWRLVLDAGALDGDPEAIAAKAEGDDLILALLTEAQVTSPEAEKALTVLRRWLLLSERWNNFPKLVTALAAQARHNQGAWLLYGEEHAALETDPDPAIAAAYWPDLTEAGRTADHVDAVTAKVAEQYRRWPYPTWSRISVRSPSTIPSEIEKRDGGRSSGLPVDAEILVAGCGTGREPAILRRRYPDAHITAIDLSATSLDYATRTCAALGIDGIEFHQLDLHQVATLGRNFHFITSSGVLHHLPDPEAGWRALVDVLRPGGVMKIMLYSKLARLRIRAAQAMLSGLTDQPVTDDLLREARRILIEAPRNPVANLIDFYSLAGVHDLLFHRHEDPFDVPRIMRAIDALGLELLAFELPRPDLKARYKADHPDDPLLRDPSAWSKLELADPTLFAGMYDFWCRKSA